MTLKTISEYRQELETRPESFFNKWELYWRQHTLFELYLFFLNDEYTQEEILEMLKELLS